MSRFSPDTQKFIEKYKSIKPADERAFLLFCKEAIALAKQYPEDKSEIAYTMVSQGSVFGNSTEDPIWAIREYAMFLEVPDHVVYTGDGLSVADKWHRIEELVNEGLND